jgi:hypothetical protein
MFSADYPPSPTQSEADMNAMTAHVENRPYHEAFMREAINMVRLFPTKTSLLLPNMDHVGILLTSIFELRPNWHSLLMRLQWVASLFTMARSSLRA